MTVRAEQHRLAVSVQSPGWAAPIPAAPPRSDAERISDIRVSLDAIAERIAESRPRQPLTGGTITPVQERYFALKDVADSIGESLDATEAKFGSKKRSYLESSQPDATAGSVQ